MNQINEKKQQLMKKGRKDQKKGKEINQAMEGIGRKRKDELVEGEGYVGEGRRNERRKRQ